MATKAIGILVDCSGSMMAVLGEVHQAILSAYATADAAQVPMAVWGFSDWTKDPARSIIPFGMPASARTAALVKLQPAFGTSLTAPLAIVLRALKAKAATTRILLVITDSEPRDRAAAAAAIRTLEPGLQVDGISVGLGIANADLIPPMRELFGGRLRVAGNASSLTAILRSYI